MSQWATQGHIEDLRLVLESIFTNILLHPSTHIINCLPPAHSRFTVGEWLRQAGQCTGMTLACFWVWGMHACALIDLCCEWTLPKFGS